MQPLRLPFTHATETAALRHTARGVLAEWQDDSQLADSLLVITELVQNVIQHTGDGGELALSRHDDAVLIEVADHSSEPPRQRQTDPRRLGGRGLIVIAAVSDTWGVSPRPDGKVVWARMT